MPIKKYVQPKYLLGPGICLQRVSEGLENKNRLSRHKKHIIYIYIYIYTYIYGPIYTHMNI